MTEAANWRDVKAKARAIDRAWDSNDRVARRQQMREQMLAAVSGAQLAEIRQQLGLTQVQPGADAGSAHAGPQAVEQAGDPRVGPGRRLVDQVIGDRG